MSEELSRREFSIGAGLLALRVLVGPSLEPLSEFEKHTEGRLKIGTGWSKSDTLRLQGTIIPAIEPIVEKSVGLQCFLPSGMDKVPIDADVGKTMRPETGGIITSDNHILLKLPLNDLAAYRRLPHEQFHALGNLFPKPFWGGKHNWFFIEAPANWLGDSIYTARIDPDFGKRRMGELPPENALALTTREISSMPLEELHLAWGNIWRDFEQKVSDLNRPRTLAFHLKERYFQRYYRGGRPSMDQVFEWGDEWLPGFSETLKESPVCRISP